jgi:hypothetical protein
MWKCTDTFVELDDFDWFTIYFFFGFTILAMRIEFKPHTYYSNRSPPKLCTSIYPYNMGIEVLFFFFRETTPICSF